MKAYYNCLSSCLIHRFKNLDKFVLDKSHSTFSRFCTHSQVATLPVVRSRKEAFSDEKARKSPRMSPIFDLQSADGELV